jgi:hypothetical protein
LIGPRDAEIGTSLLNTRYRVAQIIVLYQRGASQILKLFVFEDVEPPKIRK